MVGGGSAANPDAQVRHMSHGMMERVSFGFSSINMMDGMRIMDIEYFLSTFWGSLKLRFAFE